MQYYFVIENKSQFISQGNRSKQCLCETVTVSFLLVTPVSVPLFFAPGVPQTHQMYRLPLARHLISMTRGNTQLFDMKIITLYYEFTVEASLKVL